MLLEREISDKKGYPSMQIRKTLLIPAILAVFLLGVFSSHLVAQQHRLRDARSLLVRAQEHLEASHGEFAGHRLKAMEHVKAAVIEIDLALAANR
jgi:hypothetical protein